MEDGRRLRRREGDYEGGKKAMKVRRRLCMRLSWGERAMKEERRL